MRTLNPANAASGPHLPRPGRPHVHPANKTGRTSPIMTHAVEFTAEERAEVDTLTGVLYQKALRLIEEANQFRAMASLPLPVDTASLYASLIPRQAVSR